MKYVIITPVKNEEKYIKFTLDSVCTQTLLPSEWIIVDDNSTDSSAEIIFEYVNNCPWVRLVHKSTCKVSSYASKVMDAFYFGYERLAQNKYDFIVKLDSDLSFPSNYFETISTEFRNDSKLGITGGYLKEGSVIQKIDNYFPYVQGAIKSVRSTCFSDINGFRRSNGWDGLDQLEAMSKGWKVKVLPIEVIHHRPETSTYASVNLFILNGVTSFQQRNSFLIAILKSILRFLRTPYFLHGFFFLLGYLKAYVKRYPYIVSEELGEFINKYYLRKIFRRLIR